jgi:D-tyrosyl-tRNA(Tyr) deacylase
LQCKTRGKERRMRAVIQRVNEARVEVSGRTVGAIGRGLLVLLGIERSDSEGDADYLVSKIVHLRVFEDGDQKFNLSLKDVGGAVLVVSQFTLLGDCRKGRRPSFDAAAPPDKARGLYEHFIALIAQYGLAVASGEFQASMQVCLVNDGPVTVLLDSKKAF